MKLESIRVENFRALRHAQLGFDDTTVLIGENDCGKSSLLEALAIVLDPEGGAAPRFQAWHFHRVAPRAGAQAAGPIRITLRFRERRAGEWDALADSPLGAVLRPAADTLRILFLEVQADPAAGEGGAVSRWRLRAAGAAARSAVSDPQALATLRQINPLIWLRGGSIVGAFGAAAPLARVNRFQEPEKARLVERIEESYAALVGGTAADIHATLNEGFEAAREFIGSAARHLGGQHHNFSQVVAEILGRRRALPEDDPNDLPLRFANSTAERIGVLVLMAALLRVVPGSLPVDAEPLWIIEDPETQLHPMTLAAVLRLVRHVRWQKIITTQSGEVLMAEPLKSLRRLERQGGEVRAWRVRPRSLSVADLRRVSYHLRARHRAASFARCWLLVEGETEYWVLPEMARLKGYDFAVEGVVCVEFAQCGLAPLIKLARELGIEWHVLTDGDEAGEAYRMQAGLFVSGEPAERRITVLPAHDIESCFFESGYADVFRRLAGTRGEQAPRKVILRAIERHSKPQLALEMVAAAGANDSPGVPATLGQAIEACIALARQVPGGPGANPAEGAGFGRR